MKIYNQNHQGELVPMCYWPCIFGNLFHKDLFILVVLFQVNHDKVQRVSGPLGGLLSKDPDLKYMAQRAFVTYLKSIHLRGNKEIFDVTQLPVEEYALSLGLPTTPRIRVLEKGRKNAKFDKSVSKKEVLDDPKLMHEFIFTILYVDWW